MTSPIPPARPHSAASEHGLPRQLRLLFGTTNRGKVAILKAFLETLPVEMISLSDLAIDFPLVEEDGQSPEENAEKKVRAYYSAARMPTFAIDAALAVEGFPPEKQPGVYVRRIHRSNHEVSDQEMLDYYIRELNQVGGQAPCTWRVALAFMASAQQVFVDTYSFQAVLVAKASQKLLPGTPLSSLMVDPRSGRYFSELDHRDRADAPWVKSIMINNLKRSRLVNWPVEESTL